MVPLDEKEKGYRKRLLLSRLRILCNNGFYGLLLMHMIYSVDENCETAATDGRRIFFGPRFLDELSDSELDFVMMHEILHVVLQHWQKQPLLYLHQLRNSSISLFRLQASFRTTRLKMLQNSR